MLIRQEFHCSQVQELPPKPFLMLVLEKASKLYVQLWARQDKAHRVRISSKELQGYSMLSLRASLRRLCEEGLLSYKETASGISVELVSWQEVTDE